MGGSLWQHGKRRQKPRYFQEWVLIYYVDTDMCIFTWVLWVLWNGWVRCAFILIVSTFTSTWLSPRNLLFQRYSPGIVQDCLVTAGGNRCRLGGACGAPVRLGLGLTTWSGKMQCRGSKADKGKKYNGDTNEKTGKQKRDQKEATENKINV